MAILHPRHIGKKKQSKAIWLDAGTNIQNTRTKRLKYNRYGVKLQ